MNLLAGNFFENYGLIFILVGCLLAIFVMNYYRNKQYTENEQKVMESLKVGADVKTTCGIYGTIHSINETRDGKIIVLKTDSDALIAFDARAIFSVVDRTIVEEDDLDADLTEDLKQEDNLDDLEKEVEGK